MIIDFKSFNNRRKSKWRNDGFRSLYESIIPNEVLSTIDDWKNNCKSDYVLIGGLALSYYTKPRYTEDVDLIFISSDSIPDDVYKFRRNRPHSFEHIKTGVEVELLTPEYLKIDTNIFKVVFDKSINKDGIDIASPDSLIALKLFRYDNKDKGDIIDLYNYCMENNIDINMDEFNLPEEELSKFKSIISEIDDNISENLYMLNNRLNLDDKYLKTKLKNFEIYIFDDKYGEPRFHFTKNIESKIKKYNDFQFAISLTKPFENNSFRIVDSSTGYKSMNSFKNEETLLKEWLTDNNLKKIRKDWINMNGRKIKW